ALGASATKTGTDPFHDQAPLQLRDGGDDREDRLAEGRTRINLFAERDEFHAQVMEEVERLDQMVHRAPEAVEGGDHDHIDAPGLHLGHELVEGGPALLGARDARVDELAHVGPASCPAVVAEIVKLVVAGLVGGGDPRVERDALHRAPPRPPSSAIDRNVSSWPRTMWSSTRIPMSSPTSQSRFVSARSSAEG